MYKGSNAEKLHNMCLYDLLIMMERNIEKVREESEEPCIINALTGKTAFDRHCNYRGHCNECVRAFLAETQLNERNK